MLANANEIHHRKSMMTSECYVFIDGLEEKPVICGYFKLDNQSKYLDVRD